MKTIKNWLMTVMQKVKEASPVFSNLALAYLTISMTVIMGLLGGIFNIVRTQQLETAHTVGVHTKAIQKHDDQIVQLSNRCGIPYVPYCEN